MDYKIYHIYVDSEMITITKKLLEVYPDCLMTRMAGGLETESRFVVIDTNRIYIDMDRESIKIIVNFMRGYAIDFSQLSINTIMKLHRDSSVLQIEKLREHLDKYLPKPYTTDEIRSMIDIMSSIIEMVIGFTTSSDIDTKWIDNFLIPLEETLKSDDVVQLITFYLSDQTQTYRKYITTKLGFQCALEFIVAFLSNIIKGGEYEMYKDPNGHPIMHLLNSIKDIKNASGVDACSDESESEEERTKNIQIASGSDSIDGIDLDNILQTITEGIKMVTEVKKMK